MKIFDSVHGFIHFNDIESNLIDTEVFQRLHYIHQLGISYLIYPGGTHTRFEHSLGTMQMATQIFDQVAKKEDREYWRQIVRLAALCHDLGHLPFSHVAENRLLGKDGHEKWTAEIILSPFLERVWEIAKDTYPQFSPYHVAKLAVGEKKWKELYPEQAFSPMEKLYTQIITGDFFGADRMDYLLRDSKATGVSYGLFDYTQLIEMLVLIPQEKGTWTLGIEENGLESCEALLLSRHFMQRRVYQYSTAKAYSFHLARFMEQFYRDKNYTESVENYLSMSEHEILCELDKARKDPSHPGHSDAICIFDRNRRFQAIHLSKNISFKQLESFKEVKGIPQTKIHWDLANQAPQPYRLTIPMIRKDSQIISADDFSEFSIPPSKKNWLYLSREYNFQL